MPANPDSSVIQLRYRRLFEAARDGILILDAATGRIVDANPFMTELLGYEHDEFVGKELWEIGLFSDQAANRAAYEVLSDVGYIRYEHLPLIGRDGKEVEVEFVSNVYLEGENRVIQCNIRDITIRRALEKRFQEQAEELADSNRRKDEFLAILSHELRNPLASILNAVQIFQHSKSSDPIQNKAMGIVDRQVGQLMHLVDDLLETTRLTTGAIELRLERCEAGAIIRHAIDGLAGAAAAQGLEVLIATSPGPIWINADPARIEQIVVNLLTNAIKYNDRGGRIDVILAHVGEEMVLKIRDTGIGISAELLPRVFDLFTQADRSLVRSQGGLGIGLTIVQRLVGMHHGTIEATSPGVGYGSEFILRMPAEPEPPIEPILEAVLPSLRVLVVDDNVDFGVGISLLLQSVGYVVKLAYNGAEALEEVTIFRPDVVVLDIGLPGMDGYEVARQLRLDPDLVNLRVVAVSGYRQEIVSPRSIDARFDDYLMKPVLISTLVASLSPFPTDFISGVGV